MAEEGFFCDPGHRHCLFEDWDNILHLVALLIF